MEHKNFGINTVMEKELSIDELREKAASLHTRLTDLNQAVRFLYDELRDIPESKELSILEKKLDSVKNNTEYGTINKKIDDILVRKPDLQEKRAKKEKLEEDIKLLGTELSEINTKIRKFEILDSRNEFLAKVLSPLIQTLQDSIDQNYGVLDAYSFKVKNLTEEAGMKLNDALKTLPMNDTLRIEHIETAIGEKERIFEELSELKTYVDKITGEARHDSESIGSAGQQVIRIEKTIAGKRLLEII